MQPSDRTAVESGSTQRGKQNRNGVSSAHPVTGCLCSSSEGFLLDWETLGLAGCSSNCSGCFLDDPNCVANVSWMTAEQLPFQRVGKGDTLPLLS